MTPYHYNEKDLYRNEILACKCGRKYFTVRANNKDHYIYKFNYFYGSVNEGYIMCFYYWLPEDKRVTAKGYKKPQLQCCTSWQYTTNIKLVIKDLLQKGYINLDEIDLSSDEN